MKTEEFDDAIKRKLESINPTFTEKDIDRIHRYTVINRSPFALLRTTRAFWAMMATGMLVTGLVTWKLTSMFVHTPAPTVIVKTRPATTVEQKSNSARIVTKTDTIYVTKYKYINKYPDSYIKTQAVIHKKALATGKQYSDLAIDDNRERNGQLSNYEIVPVKKQNLVASSEPVTDSKSANPEAKKLSNTNGSVTQKQEPTSLVTENKTPVAKNKDSVASEKKEVVKKEIAKKAPIHNYADEHKLPETEKPVNVNFMVGVGGETTLANAQSGLGIFTKLLFNNTVSMNTGIKLMNVNQQYYATNQDFKNKYGVDFSRLYAPGCTVKDINFTYSLLQLPLAIEYNVPVSHNFSLSASLGTNIDLSCTNSLAYQYSNVYAHDDFISTTLTKNYPTIAFNDMVGSIGVIYQIRHFDIQFSPFINRLNGKVWYQGKDQTFYGANLKVFYCF